MFIEVEKMIQYFKKSFADCAIKHWNDDTEDEWQQLV